MTNHKKIKMIIDFTNREKMMIAKTIAIRILEQAEERPQKLRGMYNEIYEGFNEESIEQTAQRVDSIVSNL